MEYTVVTATDMDILIIKVNELIVKGWKPQGGVNECGVSTMQYCQAMIKS